MKKIIISSLILAALSCGLLAGCNGGIGSHDHDYGKWTVTVQPTCTEKGTRERTCSICNHVEVKEADPLPHAFNLENVCGDCGLTLSYSTGLSYELTADGKSYVLTGVGSCLDANIVLPYAYEGKLVTEVKERAFVGSAITSFTAQNSLKTIGKSAFNESKLKSVYLCDSVEEIESFAFAFCSSLETVRLSENLKTLNDIFYSCSALKEVELGSKLTEIASLAFFECASLEELYLPSSVTKIGARAFSGCEGLKTIGVPAGVTVIENGLFVNCTSLRRVTFFGKPQKFCMDLFMACKKLDTVVYGGTVKEFQKTERERLWEGDVDTGRFTVQCTNGKLTFEEVRSGE